MEEGWQVKEVPSTAFSFAENFPQALVHAGKYLRQQQKIIIDQNRNKSSMNMYCVNQQEDEEGRRIFFRV